MHGNLALPVFANCYKKVGWLNRNWK